MSDGTDRYRTNRPDGTVKSVPAIRPAGESDKMAQQQAYALLERLTAGMPVERAVTSLVGEVGDGFKSLEEGSKLRDAVIKAARTHIVGAIGIALKSLTDIATNGPPRERLKASLEILNRAGITAKALDGAPKRPRDLNALSTDKLRELVDRGADMLAQRAKPVIEVPPADSAPSDPPKQAKSLDLFD